MKSILTFLLLLPVFTVFAQNDTSAFYESKNNMLEVRGEKIYNYYYQIYPSTMAHKSGYVLIDSTGTVDDLVITDKGVRYIKEKFETSRYGQYTLVGDYLEQKEYALSLEVRKQFPYADSPNSLMIHKGYYRGLQWEYTNETCIAQRNKIDMLLQQKKDSLLEVHAGYTEITNAFLTTVSSADLSEMKKYMAAVETAGFGYTRVVMNNIAENNPQLFFSFMETIPKDDRYHHYYYAIDYKHYRLLKKADTNSPIQRDLKKVKRRNAWITTGGITAAVAEIGGIVWGIVYLITRNK